MDWTVPDGIYFRCYGGRQAMVGDTADGEVIPEPDNEQADVPLEHVADIGEKLARSHACVRRRRTRRVVDGHLRRDARLEPVLGPLPGIDGLHRRVRLLRHGFKLSPMIGRIVAQAALGLTPDLPVAPYSIERFARRQPAVGGYGASVVS
jgi:glycine/D-amino acid oxidase-like deaminating enzyme